MLSYVYLSRCTEMQKFTGTFIASICFQNTTMLTSLHCPINTLCKLSQNRMSVPVCFVCPSLNLGLQCLPWWYMMQMIQMQLLAVGGHIISGSYCTSCHPSWNCHWVGGSHCHSHCCCCCGCKTQIGHHLAFLHKSQPVEWQWHNTPAWGNAAFILANRWIWCNSCHQQVCNNLSVLTWQSIAWWII